jgi:hypothetical protein
MACGFDVSRGTRCLPPALIAASGGALPPNRVPHMTATVRVGDLASAPTTGSVAGASVLRAEWQRAGAGELSGTFVDRVCERQLCCE